MFYYFKMWPDNPIFVFSGPNRLPAGGEERSGELEERPCEEDQNAGVRAEAREVSSLPPTAASAHPQNTQIPQLVCSVSMFCTLLKIYSCLWEIWKKENLHGSVRFSLVNKSTSAAPAQSEHTPECSSLHFYWYSVKSLLAFLKDVQRPLVYILCVPVWCLSWCQQKQYRSAREIPPLESSWWCLVWTKACVGTKALFAVGCWWRCTVLSGRTGWKKRGERNSLEPPKTRSPSQLSFSSKPEELHCSHSHVH